MARAKAAIGAAAIAVAAARKGQLAPGQLRTVRVAADATYEELCDLAEKFDALMRALIAAAEPS